MSGQLFVYYGPMFGGKTSKLIHEITIHNSLGDKCLFINHGYDTRSKESHSCHIGGNIPVGIDSIKTLVLSELDSVVKNYKVIAIDEAQFFDETIVETVKKWVDEYRLTVYVAGLHATFEAKKFGYILDLTPEATLNVYCHATCDLCRLDGHITIANFSMLRKGIRKSHGDVLIGGSGDYIPVCRNHFKSSGGKSSTGDLDDSGPLAGDCGR